MLEQNSLKVEQFYNLNPEVKEDCSNMWPSECLFIFLPYDSRIAFADSWRSEYRYCVEASG